MNNKRSGQVLTIIICVALIITVTFMKVFFKDKYETASSVSIFELSDETNTDKELGVADTSANNESIKENTGTPVEGTPIEEVDTSLYVEDPASEAVPEGVTNIRFAITNGEVLYEQDFPSGIYKYMNVEIQKFINENIKNPESITEVTIQEDTVKEDKENKKLQYDVILNDSTTLVVAVDLYNFEYKFQRK